MNSCVNNSKRLLWYYGTAVQKRMGNNIYLSVQQTSIFSTGTNSNL